MEEFKGGRLSIEEVKERLKEKSLIKHGLEFK
jgi:hypothetical protein